MMNTHVGTAHKSISNEKRNASILLASITNTKQDAWATLLDNFISTFCLVLSSLLLGHAGKANIINLALSSLKILAAHLVALLVIDQGIG